MARNQNTGPVTVVAVRPFFNGADRRVEIDEQVTLPRQLAAELYSAGKVRMRTPEEAAHASARKSQAKAPVADETGPGR